MTGSNAHHDCDLVKDCVLKRPGMAEENVVCPMHFWGFKHVIELPPKQVDVRVEPAESAVSSESEDIAATEAVSGPQLAAAFNAALSSAGTHEKELLSMKAPGGGLLSWKVIEKRPEGVLDALSDGQLDLVYFYCHARGGVGDPDATNPPRLEFSDQARKQTLQYSADEMEMTWARKPLVIVNGCSTAAFSPDALSPFVLTFTRDCKAGGVIGTEIPVHEDLASDVAQRLIQRVLNGEEVGPALLGVRRDLLAECNPIGLAYTLYAFSEHRLACAVAAQQGLAPLAGLDAG